MKNNLMQQITTVKWWGKLKYILQQLTFYTTIMMLGFTSISAYTTGIQPYLEQHGINLPFAAFIAIIIFILIVAVLLEYKLTLPGFHSVWNEQWWRHDNPMRVILEKMEILQKEQDKRLEAIEKKLGIKDNQSETK